MTLLYKSCLFFIVLFVLVCVWSPYISTTTSTNSATGLSAEAINDFMVKHGMASLVTNSPLVTNDSIKTRAMNNLDTLWISFHNKVLPYQVSILRGVISDAKQALTDNDGELYARKLTEALMIIHTIH